MREKVSERWKALVHKVYEASERREERAREERLERVRQKIQARNKDLIKSRPQSLEHRYELISTSTEAAYMFERVRKLIFTAIDIRHHQQPKRASFFKEYGKMEAGRRFFFIKPPGQSGWLFETTPKGWVISKADKIVHQGMFLREGDAVDHVNLYQAGGRQDFVRVVSKSFGSDLLSMTVYEQKLLSLLGLGDVGDMIARHRFRS